MIAIIIGFAIIPLFMVKDGEFAGADYRAEKAINEIDESYKPWFSPIFEPKSGEVETFFFALQATIGAGVFGYGLGYMGGRKRRKKRLIMIYIDKYAYISKFNNQDPMYKLIFCFMTIVVCLWANSVIVSTIILLVMGWYTVCKGGIPLAVFLKLMVIPMSFLIIGILMIAINVSDKQNIFQYYISALGTYIGVSQTSAHDAVHLFFKSLGAVSCLYYLSLSTPMINILQVLDKFKIPKLFIELMGLTYRFILVLLETVDMMFTAQKSRMGYSSINSCYHSLAALASTLFIRAYKRSDELYNSLEARIYDGELNVLDMPFTREPLMYTVAIAFNLSLVALTLVLRHFIGGLI